MKTADKKTIILSGGGSGGPVAPLLAIAKELLGDSRFSLVFVGTKKGPEKSMLESLELASGQKIKFLTLPAGKWRRYFSWANFSDILKIFSAFIISFPLLQRERPDLIISAGGFVSVPLVWAAFLKRIPVIVHQQDVRAGLANRLMAPAARLVTVTFEKSLRDYGPQAVWIGNPTIGLENEQEEINLIRKKYQVISDEPLVVITGGATGARGINELIFQAKAEILPSAQIIHVAGLGKLAAAENIENQKTAFQADNHRYQVFELLPPADILRLMAAADLVISRCGLATLTELCILKKPAILIPMPDSHQEENAAVFKRLRAAIVWRQDELSAGILAAEIKNTLANRELLQKLSTNISKIMKQHASETMLALIKEILIIE